MNHTYIAGNDKFCRTCKRDALDHSDSAVCEACINIGPCDLSDGILLCADCMAKQVPKEHAPLIAYTATNIEQMSPVAAIANNKSISYGAALDTAINISPYSLQDLPLNGNEFFNAKTIAIKELEEFIQKDDSVPADQKRYKLAEQMQYRYLTLKKACLDATELILEAKSGMAAITVGLNEIASKLRKEEREKLKIEHIDYQPSNAVAPKVVRVSKADKATQQYADLMGITFEHAKKLLAQTLKEAHDAMGNKCSCAETPGICKVHKS